MYMVFGATAFFDFFAQHQGAAAVVNAVFSG
jgi:hypothetical protein